MWFFGPLILLVPEFKQRSSYPNSSSDLPPQSCVSLCFPITGLIVVIIASHTTGVITRNASTMNRSWISIAKAVYRILTRTLHARFNAYKFSDWEPSSEVKHIVQTHNMRKGLKKIKTYLTLMPDNTVLVSQCFNALRYPPEVCSVIIYLLVSLLGCKLLGSWDYLLLLLFPVITRRRVTKKVQLVFVHWK